MEAMNKAKKTMMRVGWGLSFTLVSAAQAACVPLTGTAVAGGLGEAAKTALVRWLGEARLPLAMCLSCPFRSSCGRCWRYPPACSARATSRELALLLLLLPLLLWHCLSGHWWPLCCFQCRLVFQCRLCPGRCSSAPSHTDPVVLLPPCECRFWVVLAITWGLIATVVSTALPLWEARESLWTSECCAGWMWFGGGFAPVPGSHVCS